MSSSVRRQGSAALRPKPADSRTVRCGSSEGKLWSVMIAVCTFNPRALGDSSRAWTQGWDLREIIAGQFGLLVAYWYYLYIMWYGGCQAAPQLVPFQSRSRYD